MVEVLSGGSGRCRTRTENVKIRFTISQLELSSVHLTQLNVLEHTRVNTGVESNDAWHVCMKMEAVVVVVMVVEVVEWNKKNGSADC